MEKKLDDIFSFLLENRKYNKELQNKFYCSAIYPYSTIEERVVSVLYGVANTQSQPKIDQLAEFFRSIFSDKECLQSFNGFVRKVDPKCQEINYNSLFNGLKNQKGWGNKTAALFCKGIYHMHNKGYSSKLMLWKDAPATILITDKFYLPVDAVIIAIFNKLNNSCKWSFDKINGALQKRYNGEQMEVWDDLWFWGFITQHGSGDVRKHEWNENKYWALKDSDKNPEKISEIKTRAELFLNLLS